MTAFRFFSQPPLSVLAPLHRGWLSNVRGCNIIRLSAANEASSLNAAGTSYRGSCQLCPSPVRDGPAAANRTISRPALVAAATQGTQQASPHVSRLVSG